MASIAPESKLALTFLGNSGLRVSNICLGCMTFGESRFGLPNQLDEAASHQMINRYVEWGGNFLDTANIYGPRNSEKIVGSWLSGQERDRFVIATKVRFNMDPTNPNAWGLSRRHITQSVDESLERLQTNYIDLMQTHCWDNAVPLEETLMTLNDLVRCGKVRYVGASNVCGWQMQRIVDLSQKMDFNQYISLQQQYSLVSRDSESEPFQVCKQFGIGVLPWSPLKGGFLTGKVKRDSTPTEGRLGFVAKDPKRSMQAAPSMAAMDKDQYWDTLATVEKIAKAKGKTIPQVALRWLLQKPIVSSVIIGATKISQMDDNLGAGNGWSLTDEEMAELDEVSKPDFPYPYEMISRMNVDRINPWIPS